MKKLIEIITICNGCQVEGVSSLDFELLRNYVHRMFMRRSAFAEFMERKTGIKLPKSYSYKIQLERADKLLGSGSLFEALSLRNEQEALEKISLITLFVCIEYNHLYELANRLGVSVNREMNRGDLTRAILVSSKLDSTMPIFKNLAREKFIVVTDFERRILGPLGVTVLKPDDAPSATIVLIRLFREMKLDLMKIITNKMKMKTRAPAETTQEILSDVGVNETFHILSNMILSGELQVSKLEEAIPFGARVHSRYGISYIGETPVEMLAGLLCAEFSEQDLIPYLNLEHDSHKDRVLAYCIRNSPFEIINTLMGGPLLRRGIPRFLGIKKANLPSQKSELINLILFHLGFYIPESPKGLDYYTGVLKGFKRTVSVAKRNETVVGSVASAFVETEKVLKDMIFFYGAHLVHDDEDRLHKRKWQIDAIEKETLRICYGRNPDISSIEKAPFGKLVEILRLLEKQIRIAPQLAKRFAEYFERNTLLDSEGHIVQLLDQMSPHRKYFVHDVGNKGLKDSKSAMLVIQLMNKLAENLIDIYPTPILGIRIVTDNFGTTYLIAKDEQDREYTIYTNEYFDDEVLQHQHFMKASKSSIVLNPILVYRPQTRTS